MKGSNSIGLQCSRRVIFEHLRGVIKSSQLMIGCLSITIISEFIQWEVCSTQQKLMSMVLIKLIFIQDNNFDPLDSTSALKISNQQTTGHQIS